MASLTIEAFLKQYSDRFPPFPELSLQMRDEIIQKCNDILRKSNVAASSDHRAGILLALACLRTLSRDKDRLGTLTSPETVALLIKHAQLSHHDPLSPEEQPKNNMSHVKDADLSAAVIESEKVLHNLLILSPEVRGELCNMDCINSLMVRLRSVRDNNGHDEKTIPYDLVFFLRCAALLSTQFFDLRILFLITALTPSTRSILRYDLDAAKVVYDLLNIYLDRGVLLEAEQQRTELAEREVSDSDADLLIEISKVVYNLTITLERFKPNDEETMIAVTLVKTVRRLLLVKAASEEKTHKLRIQAVNLLTGVPRNSYHYLVQQLPNRVSEDSSGAPIGKATNSPLPPNDADLPDSTNATVKSRSEVIVKTTIPDADTNSTTSIKHHAETRRQHKHSLKHRIIDFMGYDMNPVVMLTKILQTNLERCTRQSSQLHTQETLVPILTCLCEASRSNRIIRKFLKLEILPPLDRDALQQRPEIGAALRNKLCSLMTSPVTEVKLLAAEFLFVLCKESVERLVRYTGYGNAAGLLASRGLMAPQKAAEQEARSASNYSDNEDSDTETYDELREKINPVLGCVEDDPRYDPMAGMTEEEKEYEAMKLVDIIDRMARQGVVQPMRIGADGKPRPVEHVLEMREAVLSIEATSSSAATSNNEPSGSGDRKKRSSKRDDSVDDVE